MSDTLSVRAARRLALARAGLLKPGWTGMPSRAAGKGARARRAAHRIIDRFGYLQLDTVSIAGARSHAIVLMSRLEGFEPGLAEELLQPGEPVYEYWGHEACWLPMSLYPVFGFRRDECGHPWWGSLCEKHPDIADALLQRARSEGPFRSADLDGAGRSKGGWWDLKIAVKVAAALWSRGDLAIRERRNFQRVYDLSERVIPQDLRYEIVSQDDALDRLLLKALDGHGWATTGTLTQTWRLRNRQAAIKASLARLMDRGTVVSCDLAERPGVHRSGWIRPDDLALAHRLEGTRPRRDRGVLLSPFDPVLWDRARVRQMFGFEQVLEIFKPAAQRVYGYYCLPVLAGERLIARFDLKADRRKGRLQVLALHFESDRPKTEESTAVAAALARYSDALQLTPIR